ncbi:response regulator [Erythrobacter arachoides]|uniref:Response regulator n=1 Tax=Aurantiacibacter arachoides TaxID=1850444 RepID=A0A844ZZE0_9SPHN|nr:response regulator [Aurantiacibacter arachoides]MXO92296.1 response regulator [Aurantiacibacter arachoides]GGD58256.1 hypothetical protein GCM10011411_17950 [Aurantiacibacter arachoides]
MPSKDKSLDSAKTAARGKALGRVLLVEDDPVLAMTLEDAFLRAGTREVVICTTMQATKLELEKNERTDAIVLDVHLGDRNDGWAIAEIVTMLGARPPRIAFSTGSPESIPPEVAELGPVFEKPYDPDLLVQELSAREQKRGLIARMFG